MDNTIRDNDVTVLGPNDPRGVFRVESKDWWDRLRSKQIEHEIKMQRDVQLLLPLTSAEESDTLEECEG